MAKILGLTQFLGTIFLISNSEWSETKLPDFWTVLTFPDWGLNSDRIRHIFDKNTQKLDFRPIGSVETREHVLACVACSFLTHSGDALREMFMLILFPTNAVAVFQIYYENGYTRRSYLIDINWHLKILCNIYKVHKKLSTE